MKTKFSEVPKDSDTKITEQNEVLIGQLEALHQKWCWDGVKGESLIFVSEDVTEYNEDELIAKCRKTGLMRFDSSTTFKQTESGFTFVNFNFAS